MNQIPFSLNSKDIKKGRCPQCMHKGRFVFYVNNETLEKIGDKYGKCDRIESCQYHLSPNKGSVTLSDNYTPPPSKPTSYHPFDLVTRSGSHFKENNFVQFLKLIANDDLVQEAILKYLIGTSKRRNGATVFWQIDRLLRVRSGKIMPYNKSTGKRIHFKNGAHTNWVHSVMNLKDYELEQCLFGLHLINESNTKTIAIVEGEKTAVICSIKKPEYVWLSCGGKGQFKYEMLKPVKEFNIVAYPDKGCYENWSEKAEELNSFGYKILVSDALEKSDLLEGDDLADYFIDEMLRQDKTPTKPMKLLSANEMIAEKLRNKSPGFDLLVKTFDLNIN